MTESRSLTSIFLALHEGDKSAFTELYRELKTPVYTIILRMVQSRPLAEDIMQDVFVKLYQTPPPDSVQNHRAWVFQMAHNQAIDGLRKNRTEPLPDDLTDDRPSLEETISHRMDVEEAIKCLAPEDRAIITLRFNAGLTFREIGEMLGRPLGTVLWRYQKCIGLLQRYLNA